MHTHRKLLLRILVIWTLKIKVFIYRECEWGQSRQRGWPASCGDLLSQRYSAASRLCATKSLIDTRQCMRSSCGG